VAHVLTQKNKQKKNLDMVKTGVTEQKFSMVSAANSCLSKCYSIRDG
jgi:hypothetical protein